MNKLVCITNDIRGLNPCTQRGKHASNCDGIARRWEIDDSLSFGSLWWPDGKVREKLVELTDSDGNALECRGCLPAEAEKGLLCWSCALKAEQAFNIGHDMITHLASIDRAQQLDNAGVRGSESWKLPTPATWRLADEMIMLLGHQEPGFPSTATVWEVDVITERIIEEINFDVWIARKAGAEAAVRFYKLMQHAMSAHPMAEYEHPVRNVRCPKCRERTLMWKPPLAFETVDPANPYERIVSTSPIEVECTNLFCGEKMEHDAYERIAEIEENVLRQALGKAAHRVKTPREDEAEPICLPCYQVTFPGVDKHDRLAKRKPVREHCAICGNATRDGLYVALPRREPGRYEGLSYAEIRDLAKARGIDHRGKGIDIVARLEAADTTETETA